MTPVAIRNVVVSHQRSLTSAFASSHGGLNFYIGNSEAATGFFHPVPGITPNIKGQSEDARRVAEKAIGRPLDDAETSSYFFGLAWAWIGEHPGDAARLFARKLGYTFSAHHIALPHSYPFYAYDVGTMLRFYAIGPWLLIPLGLVGLACFAPAGASPPRLSGVGVVRPRLRARRRGVLHRRTLPAASPRPAVHRLRRGNRRRPARVRRPARGHARRAGSRLRDPPRAVELAPGAARWPLGRRTAAGGASRDDRPIRRGRAVGHDARSQARRGAASRSTASACSCSRRSRTRGLRRTSGAPGRRALRQGGYELAVALQQAGDLPGGCARDSRHPSRAIATTSSSG